MNIVVPPDISIAGHGNILEELLWPVSSIFSIGYAIHSGVQVVAS
jgi:hypothetical protein